MCYNKLIMESKPQTPNPKTNQKPNPKTKSKTDKNQAQKPQKAPEKSPLKTKLQRLRTKLLISYYNNPAKDLKLVCITGSTDKANVARFVHEILQSADIKSAVLASDGNIKPTIIHKFLNDARKNGASYAIITAPATALEANVFHQLPISVAALTNFIPSISSFAQPGKYLNAKINLFAMQPEIIILNQDDRHYADFAKFKGSKKTFSYGTDTNTSVRIDDFTLYKKGSEANLAIGFKSLTTATFLTGESAISAMACAAAIAHALNIAPDIITDGISNYEPNKN